MAAADQMTLEIVTPERGVVTLSVDEVVLPSVDGYMGVRPGHAPLLAQLDVGEISYRVGSEERFLAVSGGFAEVLPERVGILAQACEPAEDIDLERAQRAKEKAETALQGKDQTADDRAAVKLQRALARIRVHGRLKR